MVMAYFVENFWGEKNNGFDVLYHNMKHGQISTKELSEFIRERSTIEEAYSRSMTKLAKTASNYTQLGTFGPVWDVFKTSTEKLAGCHLELVKKLQDLIKELQKYGEEQLKSHKKTKEEVSGTLEAVQSIQSITQALQKSKELYNIKCVDQERLKKEGAAQKEIEKASLKAKKATESYKGCVEKYAAVKSDFEQKMAETAQKFQDIEKAHLIRVKDIIGGFSHSISEVHIQIGQVHEEFINNMANITVESLLEQFAESKGTGKERPGLIEFEACNTAIAIEGLRTKKRKPFGLPTIIKKEKDTESVENADSDSINAPTVDEEGYSIKPEDNQNYTKENHFYSSSDSEPDDDGPKKFHVEIKPVQPNNGSHHTMASLDELKVSIGNISLSPAPSRQSPAHMTRNASSDEMTKLKISGTTDRVNSDLLAWDPLFGNSVETSSLSSSSSTAALKEPFGSFAFSPTSLTSSNKFTFDFPMSDPGDAAQSDFGTNFAHNVGTVKAQVENTHPQRPQIALYESNSRTFIRGRKKIQRFHSAFEKVDNMRYYLSERTLRNYVLEDYVGFSNANYCLDDVFVEENSNPTEKSSKSASINCSLPTVHTNNVSPPARPTTPLSVGTIVPPPRPPSRPKLPSAKLSGINEVPRPFSPPVTSNTSPPSSASLPRAESSSSISSSASISAANTPTFGISRGPSPVTLGSQDTLPVAVALSESVNAYFKGADPAKCIVKVTGDMTVSFPSGIIKVFTSNPSPAVLCFRIKNTSKLEQILPNTQLLYSDPSQSDNNCKDFWMNMQAVTAYLKKSCEQNPSASYYNVDILKYQVSSNGIQSTPLNLATYWKCNPTTTDVRLDYKYNPESMVAPSALSNIQVVVPVDGGVTNMQSIPTAIWNSEQMKALWKISAISEKSENGGSGSLRAKFDISEGPSNPSTLAVQFVSDGGTLSGVDIELVGTGYRLSLVKKRFCTGRYMADC
ncbi:F-BAR domain only protein 2 isoform X2 [Rana temporaria]|uniref:F-BAR domain only protein 2 isoform X2 n=1 Tax=Rana temporaria TaxID=8407 RepID=UPI001AACE014|nr:F-BAR domain only protein 2 isoform X2 [Rana temporaria]